MHRSPFAVDVHAVIRDVSSVRRDSVALRAEVFASEPKLWQPCIPGLQAVFVGHSFVVQGPSELPLILLRPLQRVDERKGSCPAAMLCQFGRGYKLQPTFR